MSDYAFPLDAVTVQGGRPVTTSLKIAEIFGKRHERVLAAIRGSDCPQEFRQPNFVLATYHDAQGKARPMIELTRDGFVFVCMGFTGARAAAFKVAYIARFNAMEAQLKRAVSLGIEVAPVQSLGQYLETRDTLNALRGELDALFGQLGNVEIRCTPAEIDEITDPRIQVGKKVHLVRDLVQALQDHGLPRHVAMDLTGHNANAIRQFAFQARQQEAG